MSQLDEDPYVVQKFWREFQNCTQIAQTLDLAAAFMMDGCRNEPEFARRLQHSRNARRNDRSGFLNITARSPPRAIAFRRLPEPPQKAAEPVPVLFA